MKTLRFVSLLILTLSFSSSLLNAQITVRPQFGLGLTTQTHRYYGDPVSQYDIRVGARPQIEVGALVNYALKDQLSFQGGLRVLTRGSTQHEEYGTNKSKTAVSLTYLELPVGIAFQPIKDKKLWLEASLNLGMALGGRLTYTWVYDDGEREQVRDRISVNEGSGSVLRGDVGIGLGGRMGIDIGGFPIEVGGRLSLGFRSVAFDPNITMRNHAATVFVSLPLEL